MKDYLERILISCIEELFTKDAILIKNDVSERAITHKLAEYLQQRFPEYNVDCEYNRNLEQGARHPKTILMLKEQSVRKLKEIAGQTEATLINSEEDFKEVTAYPDIIVHRRGVNSRNLLIIEVKKSNSRIDIDYDRMKLSAFTDPMQDYNFNLGVLVVLKMENFNELPSLEWFTRGKRIGD